MGMDYAPRRDVEGFHLNWGGHRYMAMLLEDLGADLRRWSGSNDGDYITAATARAWARLLREGMSAGQVSNARIADRSYHDGYRHDPVVAGAPAAEVGSLRWALERIANSTWERNAEGELECHAPSEPPHYEIVPLSEEDRQWIGSFADFLTACGGCWQW